MTKTLPAILLAFCLFAPFGFAAQNPLNAVENFVWQQLPQETRHKARVAAGPLDSRLRLPPCENYQPYVPNNAPLVGNVNIGLRCLSPSRWQIFVPVKINIESAYLAAAYPLQTGKRLSPEDLLLLNGDLGALPPGILTDPYQAVGKTLKSSLAAGQPLRKEQLASPILVKQGQTVKLVFAGKGFTATNEGQAMNNAAEGEIVRARTLSGTVVSGTVTAEGAVQVGGANP